ncbi:flagellar hook-associated protein FlgL [Geodermatophilus marinus]|uniref:flagellar hook-associated protein FlgL n=1 Tax=Geodermatophilus sp. LHW52908 TaxID=2303986 RepID=UPI000E3C8F08|nr:flagellar hook-associated protein FlgL [Geodermatophilus sp. LHW52908]RFU22886.1 flagellar hook-associated protein 3 [Geodermatophilus sp. LHW52908]
MRITQRAVTLTSLQGLNRNLDAIGKMQQQLTSGKLVSRPSDSPTAANAAMRTRNDQAANAQYARNITDGRSRLDATDSTLNTMLSQVRKVRDLTVHAGNTAALPDSAREAIAVEMDQLRESLLSLANTSMQGRPLFGGIASATAAYTDAGVYQGRGGGAGEQVLRRVSDTETIRVDITGAEAFGDPALGEDLFAVVATTAAAVRAGDGAQIDDRLAALDGVLEGMRTAVADVGARAKRIEGAGSLTADQALTLTDRLKSVEDIDLAKTIMELEMQKTGYQAALAATAKAIQPSLVEFLR